MVSGSLQNLMIGGTLIAASLVPFVIIRRMEARMALHEPWIAGDLMLKAKIQSTVEITCLPGFRPLPKMRGGKLPVATEDPDFDKLAHVLAPDSPVADLVRREPALRHAIARIYDLAPSASVLIRGRMITCYVNEFNYRKRTPGFSLPAYKTQLKGAIKTLAESIDAALPETATGSEAPG